jgi:hypothetical protein
MATKKVIVGFGIAFSPRVQSSDGPHCCAAIARAAARHPQPRRMDARARARAVLLALANPRFTREDREPLSSVAAVVVDKSPSQNFGDRTSRPRGARKRWSQRLKKIKGLEVRVVEAGQADGETDGTRLFGALSSALSDVPPTASPAPS